MDNSHTENSHTDIYLNDISHTKYSIRHLPHQTFLILTILIPISDYFHADNFYTDIYLNPNKAGLLGTCNTPVGGALHPPANFGSTAGRNLKFGIYVRLLKLSREKN